jgi:hypothetical protein
MIDTSDTLNGRQLILGGYLQTEWEREVTRGVNGDAVGTLVLVEAGPHGISGQVTVIKTLNENRIRLSP